MERHHLKHFAGLFTQEQRKAINDSGSFLGRRHPTWTPVFGERASLRVADYRLNQSVPRIESAPGGRSWLNAKVRHLLDCNDINNATAAMAEIRAYGGLLEAGFDVKPVRVSGQPTPEFHAMLDGQTLIVEVAAKHQDQQQDELEQAIHDALEGDAALPEGVERRRYRGKNTIIDTVISTRQPGGAPDPSKPHDSVQTNLISRVCAMKANETQLADDRPSVLIADFSDFGFPAFKGLIEHASPIIRGHYGFTSGALWYAMYGWRDAPVFEALLNRPPPRMQHEGRFSESRDPKSKLSGVLFVLPEDAVLLENPAPNHRLTRDIRLSLCTHPRFDIAHSVLDWETGDAKRQLELQRNMIGRLDDAFETIRWR